MGRSLVFLSLASILVISACASRPPEPGTYRVNGETYKPISSAEGFYETGLASWYGEDFHGKKTSNGETYDMYARTCAHKTLPLGTNIRIRNLENGLEVTARVNDRGPFVEGRVVDLSYTLAKELEIVGPGTARVRLEALDGVSFEVGSFTWQVGSFAERSNADRLAAGLSARFKPVRIVPAWVGDRTVYRVQVGQYGTKSEAQGEKQRLADVSERPWLVGYD